MSKTSIPFLVIAWLALAAPLAAQVTDAPADSVPSDTMAMEAPPPAAADSVPPAAADSAPATAATPSHDWEFALSAGERVPGASGTVQVTEGESDNAFAVIVQGLPPIDDLDEEGRDVAAYQVWVVPSKDRVAESTLAGTMTTSPGGGGRFEGRTDLDTFGIIVMASVEGETRLSGIPILTGIPVTRVEPSVLEQAPAAEQAPAVEAEPESEPAAEPGVQSEELPAEPDPTPETPAP